MKDNTNKQLGKLLAQQRKRTGLTQAQVAEQLQISNETLSRIERGIQWTELELLVRLAKIYQVELSDLFTFPPKNDQEGKKRMAIQEIVSILRSQSISDITKARDMLTIWFKNNQ